MARVFDLERAIAAWRRPLEQNRAFSGDDIEELEQHLRDRVAARVAAGLSEEVAFKEALRRMGSYTRAETEYRKVYWGKRRRRGELLHELRLGTAMLMNYLKIAFRNLLRQKGYSFINMAGLTLGLATFLILVLYVYDAYRYDRYHAQADQIYRVVNASSEEGERVHMASTPPALGPALTSLSSDVRTSVRFFPIRQALLTPADPSFDGRSFVEDTGYYADSTVFDVFGLRLLRGAPGALAAPNTIVLTASAARRYFGPADPLGRILTLNRSTPLEVTGIVDDPPPHTHLPYGYLVSYATLNDLAPHAVDPDNWRWQDFYTYVRLSTPAAAAGVEAALAAFTAERVDPLTRPSGYVHHFGLQPLTAIYLHSGHLQGNSARQGSLTGTWASTPSRWPCCRSGAAKCAPASRPSNRICDERPVSRRPPPPGACRAT